MELITFYHFERNQRDTKLLELEKFSSLTRLIAIFLVVLTEERFYTE